MSIYNYDDYNSNQDFPSPPQLSNPSEQVNYNQPFSEVEKEVLEIVRHLELGTETEEEYMRQVEAARVRWACISSKTQRSEKNIYDIKVYENLVQINHHYSHVKGNEPPSRDEAPIYGFSKKSQYHMKKKILTMKRDNLPLPYFVTLTYHSNEQDFQKAKSHLNTFFQRFRRIGTLRYMWKMEPQKRGAIHFHLMLFLPEKIYPEKYLDDDWSQLEYARMRVSTAWNEVAQPGDNEHLKYGTNVRSVNNWRQAAGYISKYMRKEVDGKEWKDKETGRFWAVSNNFDFKPYFRHTIDMKELDEMKLLLKEICSASFEEFKQFTKKRLKQLTKIKAYHPARYKYSVLKLKRQLKNQRRRYVVNLEKIEKGASVQAELSQVVAREIIPETIHYN